MAHSIEVSWRDFQDTVGLIERLAADRNAIVRSPDTIPDVVSGKMREVDASIRQRVGTAEVLITVECRRHKAVQDVRWIEQLASKRRNIGAATTVAVSGSGFTNGAIDLARREGILLRTLADMEPDDIEALLTPVFRVTPNVEITGWGYRLFAGDPIAAELPLSDSTQAALDRDGVDAKVFVSSKGALWSLNDALGYTYGVHLTRIFDGVPEDGSTTERTFRLLPDPGALRVATSAGLRHVSHLLIRANCWLDRRLVPPHLALRYADEREQSSALHAQYDVRDGEGLMRLMLQTHGEHEAPSMVVEIGAHSGELRTARLEHFRSVSRRPDGTLEESMGKAASDGIRVVQPDDPQ